ncbi:MAG TPA: BON domain-containing protein [Frateuria sp.]|uniref:BON domain-containing protein n=1 Tax=Frateuria sp. TaxID=2211372 RepID=UPI002D7E4FD3|nr:BON domain-containing protein [Frateuria sp.]HET6806589.1 BON domain-containing protein [Frateuria sp.]
MSRHDDRYDDRSRYRTRDDRIRERNQRAPYEADRQVRTYGSDDDYAAAHPWQAAHPRSDFEGNRPPDWREQPVRYGGGYRDDEELWSRPRGTRGDARYGLDTDAERHFVEGYQDEDNRHRAHGYGRHADTWRNEPRHGQSNSGYDTARAYGEGNRQDDARSDRMHASWTQEHDYEGPRYGAGERRGGPGRGAMGSQYAHTDTYGGAGFRQQGKRYWFDEGDQRGQFRGTRPRGYERSDERLRELACEHLTEADLDASDIEVKVSQGTVTLEGSVPARWMKHSAEDIIDDLGGVQDVQNHLRVRRGDIGTGPQQSAGTSATPSPGSSTGAAPGSGSTTAASNTGPAEGLAGQGNGDIGGRSRH